MLPLVFTLVFAFGSGASEEAALFDGVSLGGWAKTPFAGAAGVRVKDGAIVLEPGSPLTGVTWSGAFPRVDYELVVEAARLSGNDFFCGLTFPVREEHATLVLGGWGGATVGLSCLDGRDASENATTGYRRFVRGTFVRVTVRVTAPFGDGGSVRAWIDDELVADVLIVGTRFSLRREVEASRPLGVASFATRAAIRRVAWRKLPPPPTGTWRRGPIAPAGLLEACLPSDRGAPLRPVDGKPLELEPPPRRGW